MHRHHILSFMLNKSKAKGSISGLSSIEEFLFEANLAHDLVSLIKEQDSLIMNLEDCSSYRSKKSFVFANPAIEYEELVLVKGEELEYPLPLIGANSRSSEDKGRYRFCFNFSDLEIAFEANWPSRV